MNEKPMSRACEANVKTNAKPMPKYIASLIERASRSNVRPGCAKMLYIYTQNLIFGGPKKERFWHRFCNDFWIGFGEVFGEVLERV